MILSPFSEHRPLRNTPLLLIVALSGCAAQSAESRQLPSSLALPGMFSNGMVLRGGSTANVFGTATPGDRVTVNPSWLTSEVTVTADAQGRWQGVIDTRAPHGPHTLDISTSTNEQIAFEDVLLGEVWLCSGQSNMVWELRRLARAGYQPAIEALNAPQSERVRYLQVPDVATRSPLRDIEGQWHHITAENVADCSGVAYWFGKEMQGELKIPVGLIVSDWGGTPAEAWTSELGMELFPGVLRREGKPANGDTASALFNGMIAPLAPYSLSGAIWYQGESNTDRPNQYDELLPRMIRDWRELFGEAFPFGVVQIAPFNYGEKSHASGLVREAQTRVLNIPRTGLVVTADVGNARDIHPAEKVTVARRLATWAIAEKAGDTSEAQSPVYSSMEREEARLRIHFHPPQPLIARGEAIADLLIAGPDGTFMPATGIVDGTTLLVSNPVIRDPVAARYAFGTPSPGTLFTESGLPVSPFRTDELPLAIEPEADPHLMHVVILAIDPDDEPRAMGADKLADAPQLGQTRLFKDDQHDVAGLAGEWVSLWPISRSDTTFGLELGLGIELARLKPRDHVAVIKMSDRSLSSLETPGALWDLPPVARALQKLRAEGWTPHIAGMVIDRKWSRHAIAGMPGSQEVPLLFLDRETDAQKPQENHVFRLPKEILKASPDPELVLKLGRQIVRSLRR